MTTDAPRDSDAWRYERRNMVLRLDKEMRAAKNVMGSLSQQIADAASDLGAVARTQAKRGLRNARANVDAVAADASDRVAWPLRACQRPSIGDPCRRSLSNASCRLALALGLGYLIGVTWRR